MTTVLVTLAILIIAGYINSPLLNLLLFVAAVFIIGSALTPVLFIYVLVAGCLKIR